MLIQQLSNKQALNEISRDIIETFSFTWPFSELCHVKGETRKVTRNEDTWLCRILSAYNFNGSHNVRPVPRGAAYSNAFYISICPPSIDFCASLEYSCVHTYVHILVRTATSTHRYPVRHAHNPLNRCLLAQGSAS